MTGVLFHVRLKQHMILKNSTVGSENKNKWVLNRIIGKDYRFLPRMLLEVAVVGGECSSFKRKIGTIESARSSSH